MLSLEEAIRFHGHKGPFMIIGYRAGLLACRLLCRNPFDLYCKARIPIKRPFSCILDGIQCSSGCTLGKLNIVIEDSEKFELEFIRMSNNSRLVLKIRKKLIETALKNIRNEKFVSYLSIASDAELFEIYREN